MNEKTITLDEALLRVFKRRNADRMKLYRRFLSEGMRFDRYMARRYEFKGERHCDVCQSPITDDATSCQSCGAMAKEDKREMITLDDIPLPDATDVAAVIKRHKEEGFTKRQLADLERYFKLWEPSIKRERAKVAAAVRWKNKAS